EGTRLSPPARRDRELLPTSVHRLTEVAFACPCAGELALAAERVCMLPGERRVLHLAHGFGRFGMQLAQFIKLATEHLQFDQGLEMGSREFGAGLAHRIGETAEIGRAAWIYDEAPAHYGVQSLGFCCPSNVTRPPTRPLTSHNSFRSVAIS